MKRDSGRRDLGDVLSISGSYDAELYDFLKVHDHRKTSLAWWALIKYEIYELNWCLSVEVIFLGY